MFETTGSVGALLAVGLSILSLRAGVVVLALRCVDGLPRADAGGSGRRHDIGRRTSRHDPGADT